MSCILGYRCAGSRHGLVWLRRVVPLSRLGRFSGNIGNLDIIEVVLADGTESVIIDTADNSDKAEAGQSILEEVWATSANQSRPLTETAIVVC